MSATVHLLDTTPNNQMVVTVEQNTNGNVLLVYLTNFLLSNNFLS